MSTQQRKRNLELYCILTILAIFAHHYVVNSGLLGINSNNEFSFRNLFSYCLGRGQNGYKLFRTDNGLFIY